MAELGRLSLVAAADFGKLEAALATVAGGAEEAEVMMARLRDVAKLPGLGLQEAVRGTARLMSAGFDFAAAERAMRGFGNAIASVGGGREELDGVLLALTQIAAKGTVSAEEINQIAERVPQIRGLMGGAFGTANTEELQKMGITAETFILGIIGELEKLPVAASTFSNSLENLVDSANTALASLGRGMANALIPEIEKVSNFLAYLSESGILDNIGNKFGQVLGVSDGGSVLIRVASILIAVVEQMPALLSAFQATVSAAMKGAEMLMASAISSFNSFASSFIGKQLGFTRLDAPQGQFTLGANLIGSVVNDIMDRAGRIEAGFNEAGQRVVSKPTGGSIRTPGGTGQPSGAGPLEGELSAQTRLLGAIEGNTRQLGRSEAFGGGALGALGVTPEELSRIGSRRSGSRFAEQLSSLIGNEMARQVDERVSDMMRYGALRTR
jgi:tape measure domain-containing protein